MDSSFENSHFLPNAESTFRRQSNNDLLITLSTIIMLAKEKQIKKEHRDITKRFLQGVQLRGKRKFINNSEIFIKKITNYGKPTDDSGDLINQTAVNNDPEPKETTSPANQETPQNLDQEPTKENREEIRNENEVEQIVIDDDQ